jgi:hypothetical protein
MPFVCSLASAIPTTERKDELPLLNEYMDEFSLENEPPVTYILKCKTGESVVMDEATFKKSPLLSATLDMDSLTRNVTIGINECNQETLDIVIFRFI